MAFKKIGSGTETKLSNDFAGYKEFPSDEPLLKKQARAKAANRQDVTFMYEGKEFPTKLQMQKEKADTLKEKGQDDADENGQPIQPAEENYGTMAKTIGKSINSAPKIKVRYDKSLSGFGK